MGSQLSLANVKLSEIIHKINPDGCNLETSTLSDKLLVLESCLSKIGEKSEDLPVISEVEVLREQLDERDRAMVVMKEKFLKNKDILMDNWQQAESEVKRLDEYFNASVGAVIGKLEEVPEVLVAHPSLQDLLASLKE